MKNVLVTGAAGFIGSHVVRQLLDEKPRPLVRGFIKPGEPTTALNGLDMEFFEGDLLNKKAVDRAMEGVDTVFHLAAVYSLWMPDWKVIWEVNMQGARNVLWAAKRHKVKKVVFTSSIAGVGTVPGKLRSTEKTPFNHYGLGNHYVFSKYLSQQEALGFAENGLDLSVVNPAFPFGINDTAPTPTGKLIIDIVKGVNRFKFEGGINIVDVRDVAQGHILAAKKGKPGQMYILANQNVTVDEFNTLVCQAAGIENRKFHKVPVSFLKGLGISLTYIADRLTHKPPLCTPTDVEYASNYLFFDNARAKNELGLKFRPVEDSLREAVEWFVENGYIS